MRRRENENKEFILLQICNTGDELSAANTTLAQLLKKAEEIAPQNEWHTRLSNDDLSSDVNALQKELKGLKANIKSIKSNLRGTNIDEMKGVFDKLFESVHVRTETKRKRIADSDDSEDGMLDSPKNKLLKSSDDKGGVQADEEGYDSAATQPFDQSYL